MKNKFTKQKIKDVLIRSGKTFVQAFLSALSIDYLVGVTSFALAKKIGLSVLIAAVAAGISAVWNLLINFLIRKIEEA